MRELLQFAGWAMCIVYASIPSFWLMVHPFADYWRSQRKNPYRVLVPGWIAMWMVIGLATWRWRRLALYENPWTWIPAVLFLLCGFWLYRQSTKNFSGRQVGGFQEVLTNQQQQLVISGIRARIRHPMYLGHFLRIARMEPRHWIARLLWIHTFRCAHRSHHDPHGRQRT